MPEPVTIPSGLENISMLAHDKILRAPGHHGKVFLKVHQLFSLHLFKVCPKVTSDMCGTKCRV